MKILITGNMGYIGPCVIAHLRACYPDAELLGLDMGYFAGCLTNTEILPECKVDLQYFVDVRRISSDILKDVDAIIAGGEKFDRDVIFAADKLRVIARSGVGYDNVDLKSSKERGIAVTSTPCKTLAVSVAQY